MRVKDEDALRLKVGQDDLLFALRNDIKPMFGVSLEQMEHFVQHGIVNWGKPFGDLLASCQLTIEQMVSSPGDSNVDSFSSMLLFGPEGVGTSALAVHLAKESGFTFIKVRMPRLGRLSKCECSLTGWQWTHVLLCVFVTVGGCLCSEIWPCVLALHSSGPLYKHSRHLTLPSLVRNI